MKISTRGRYALRMMLDIAMHNENGPVRIRDIAARQKVSVKYLEQIVGVLAKAGYLTSQRGPQGGYLLARKPAEYTVGMILRVTEGDLAPVACVDGAYDCPREEDCVTIRIWRELNEAISNVIDRYTLEDLVSWQEQVNGDYII